jgi:hypothetical protein
MEILIGFLSILSAGLLFVSINLYRKILFFEDKISDIQDSVENSIETMREIDINGSFEADDEVGDTFQQLKRIVEQIGEYTYAETTEEGK